MFFSPSVEAGIRALGAAAIVLIIGLVFEHGHSLTIAGLVHEVVGL